MTDNHTVSMHHIIEEALTTPGDTEPALRRAIEAYVVELASHPAARAGDIPTELEPYVKKVALHAYKVTDEDIEALKKAGYSEEALFEITMSAALGAGRARLQRGLAALKGDGES